MQYWTAEDTNIAAIAGPYVDNQDIAFQGRTWRVNGAEPTWGLYDEQRRLPPEYNLPYYVEDVAGTVKTFVGVVGDAAAYVDVLEAWVRMPIDDLLKAKREELEQYAERVFFSSCKMTSQGGADFWVNMSLRSRLYRTDVDAYYQWTPPPPWRNIPVWIVRVDNLNEIRYKAPRDDWTALKEAQGRFSIDVAYAADEVEEQLELAHTQDDWDALAAIDVATAPVNNSWPEHDPDVFNGAAF